MNPSWQCNEQLKRTVKTDQQAQQTQLDELLAFIEECQGEPLEAEKQPSAEQAKTPETTGEGEKDIEKEKEGEKEGENGGVKENTEQTQTPSTPVRSRKSLSSSRISTPVLESRLSARKRNSHMEERDEEEGRVKVPRMDDEQTEEE